MQHTIEKFDRYTLLTVQEEKLATTISPQLKAEIVRLFQEDGTINLMIDMSAVKYVDSSGLSAILVANRLANESEGTLVLAGVTDHVMKLISISKLDNVLTIVPTIAEGVDAIFLNQIERDLNAEDE
ncbi:STAS domain-containing protein [Rhodoflexus caldus]|uniref:STAS domain-containing protein n=1 Tax=Rhodoflexus caldus TaxID=2891236 RepID=UPI00202A2C41|nr:STAS domain-containing protein [Rhodoflexus caldus]